MLFVGAKVSELALGPQGQPEHRSRVGNMVAQMDRKGVDACSNIGSCVAEYPAGIKLTDIITLNHESLAGKAAFKRLA